MTLPLISIVRSCVVTHLDKGYLCGGSLFAPADVWDGSVPLNLQDVVQSFQLEMKTKEHLWRGMSFSLLTRKIREVWRGELVTLYEGMYSATVAKYVQPSSFVPKENDMRGHARFVECVRRNWILLSRLPFRRVTIRLFVISLHNDVQNFHQCQLF